MIRDITIGQYYQADSVIHRLDPRVKLMGTFLFIISLAIQLFLFDNMSLFGVKPNMLLISIIVFPFNSFINSSMISDTLIFSSPLFHTFVNHCL